MEGDHGRDEGLGHYETLSCSGCGYTRFYARAFVHSHLRHERRTCAECGDTRDFYRVLAYERDRDAALEPHLVVTTPTQSGGRFLTRGCGSCGLTDWQAIEMAGITPEPTAGVTARRGDPCACGHPERLWVETVRESGQALAVFLKRHYPLDRALGHFSTAICRLCGAVEWFARGLETLEPDLAHGLSLVEGKGPPAGGGPYR